MTIPMKCSECQQVSEYTLDEIQTVIQATITIQRGEITLPPNTPDPIVFRCKRCPAKFKVAKRDLERAIVDANLYKEGTRRS
jgi:hypothetical protein